MAEQLAFSFSPQNPQDMATAVKKVAASFTETGKAAEAMSSRGVKAIDRLSTALDRAIAKAAKLNAATSGRSGSKAGRPVAAAATTSTPTQGSLFTGFSAPTASPNATPDIGPPAAPFGGTPQGRSRGFLQNVTSMFSAGPASNWGYNNIASPDNPGSGGGSGPPGSGGSGPGGGFGFSAGRLAVAGGIAGAAALGRGVSSQVNAGLTLRQLQYNFQTFRGGSLQSQQSLINQYTPFSAGNWGQINAAAQTLNGVGGYGIGTQPFNARMQQSGLLAMGGAAAGIPIDFAGAAATNAMLGTTKGITTLRSLRLTPQQFGGMQNVNTVSVAQMYSQRLAGMSGGKDAGFGGMLNAKTIGAAGPGSAFYQNLKNAGFNSPTIQSMQQLLAREQKAGPAGVAAVNAISGGNATSAQEKNAAKVLGYTGTDMNKMMQASANNAQGLAGVQTGAADAASQMKLTASQFTKAVGQFSTSIDKLVGGIGIFGGAAAGITASIGSLVGHGLLAHALKTAAGSGTKGVVGKIAGRIGSKIGSFGSTATTAAEAAAPVATTATTAATAAAPVAGEAAAGIALAPVAAVAGGALGAFALSRPGHGTPGTKGAGGGGPISLQNVYKDLGMHASPAHDIANWVGSLFGGGGSHPSAMGGLGSLASSTKPPAHSFPWASGAGPSKPASAPRTTPAGSGSSVVGDAAKYLGVPYKWGGTNPKTGLDCSGFTQLVFKDMGINIPRTSQEQAKVGQAVPDLQAAQPGDLVFYGGGGWDGTPSSPGHVGIYVGGNKMIDAPHTGANVRYEAADAPLPVAIRRLTGGNGSATASNTNGGTSVAAAGSAKGGGGGISAPIASINAGSGEGTYTSESAYLTSALTPTFGGGGSSNGAVKNGAAATTGNGGTPSPSSAGGGSGTPVAGIPGGSHKSLIDQALKLAGVAVSPANESAVNLIVNHESSWNPNAVNLTDSNAQAGHPSRGLMQTIPTTFQAYAIAGHNSNINDPLSNLIAGIRYAESRYKSLENVPGVKGVNGGSSYVGYAKGATFIEKDEVTTVHKGEMVIPAARAAAMHMNQMSAPGAGGTGGGVSVTVQNITVQAAPNGTLPGQPDLDRLSQQLIKAVKAEAQRELLRTT